MELVALLIDLFSNVPGVGNLKQEIVILAIRDGSQRMFDFLKLQTPFHYPAANAALKTLNTLDKGKFFKDIGQDMPVLHKYLCDLRLIGDWGDQQPRPVQTEALQSHLDWICGATSACRVAQGGCDEAYRLRGVHVTALGLLLARPQSYRPETSDAAIAVLQTVLRHASVWKTISFEKKNITPLNIALEMRPRVPAVVIAIINQLIAVKRLPKGMLHSVIENQGELRIVRKCLEAGCSPLEQHNGATPLHVFFRTLGGAEEVKEDPVFVRERTKIFKALAGPPEARAQLNEVADSNGYTLLLYAMVNCDGSLFNTYGSQLVKWGASLTTLHTVQLEGAKRRVSALSLAMSWHGSGEKKAIANSVDQMALDAYRPALIQEFLPKDMSAKHAQHVVSWLKDHHKRTLEPIVKDKAELVRLLQSAMNAVNLPLVEVLMGCSKQTGPWLKTIAVPLQLVIVAPIDLLDQLLSAGASCNQRDPKTGEAAIHKAAALGDEGLIKLLGKHEVSFRVTDRAGNYPKDIAAQLKDKRVRKSTIQALEEHEPQESKASASASQPIQSVVPSQKQDGEHNQGAEGEGPRELTTDELLIALPQAMASFATHADEAADEEGEAVLGVDDAAGDNEARTQGIFQQLLPMTAEAPAGAEPGLQAVPPFADLEEEAEENEDLKQQQVLEGLPWAFTITSKARTEWASMDPPNRRIVFRKLAALGQGHWHSDRSVKRLFSDDEALRDQELWRCKTTRGGRIVFEVAADFDERSKTWKEMLRLWLITMSHDKYMAAIPTIQASYVKSQKVQQRLQLKATTQRQGHLDAGFQRLPKNFHQEGEDAQLQAPETDEDPDLEIDLREHFPAANPAQDTYTMLKFYNLRTELIKSVLEGLDDAKIDFPFRVSPSEQRIIEMDAPTSIILVGRSGTGKTTCAVYRMWSQWLTARSMGSTAFHQIFITASVTLRVQVAKAFRKLQAAVIGIAQADELEAVSAREYPSFANVPDDAFPLFLSTRAYLHALDATLEMPFHERNEQGAMLYNPIGMDDMEGTFEEIDLDIVDSDDEFEDKLQAVGVVDDAPMAYGTRGSLRQEVTFQTFKDIWSKLTKDLSKEDRNALQPALVYQEIFSYIKGSREALETEAGCLTLEQYLTVGKKRAPNFSSEERRRVYPVFQAYSNYLRCSKKLKHQTLWQYDNMDLVAHLYRSFKAKPYNGVPISFCYRDEVQDFTQAELLLDLSVINNPNGLFYCGDSCQTIARGVGFRFADIRTLFHDEAERRKAAGEKGGLAVALPEIEHLKVNYRTHGGIINVAASIVDLIRRFFPQHIDKLDREEAFFPGPPPLLLTSFTSNDLAILLGGSDKASSQVEFGAHQVVLVREKGKQLPEALQQSKALVMTVPQSKGLEFDDVFLLDFFADSPATAEWRVLLSYLEELSLDETADAKDPQEAGSDLRPLAFDAAQHVVLSEELKHLYTAITRAKNAVVIFDSNPKKRAPFFHYLRSLKLASVVKNILVDGKDASKLSLREVQDSPAEWSKRGRNLLDNKLFELAEQCFVTANDTVYIHVARAYALVPELKSVSPTPQAKKQLRAKIGHHLLLAIINAKGRKDVVADAAQDWVKNAAKMFFNAGDLPAAARTCAAYGEHHSAAKLHHRTGEYVLAAGEFEKAAKSLRSVDPQLSADLLQRAASSWQNAKQYHECMGVILRNPAAEQYFKPEDMDKWASTAVIYYHQQGDHQAALLSSAKIGGREQRLKVLQKYGYWRALAKATESPVEAADILAAHGDHAGALAHLETCLRSPTHPDVPAAWALRPSEQQRLHSLWMKQGTLEACEKALRLQSSDGIVRVQSSQLKKAHQRNMAEALLRKRSLVPVDQQGQLEVAEQALEVYRDANKCGWLMSFNACLEAGDGLASHMVHALMDSAEKLAVFSSTLVRVLAAGQVSRQTDASKAALADAEAFYGIAGFSSSREEPAYTAEHLQFKRALHSLQTLQAQAKQTPNEWDVPEEDGEDWEQVATPEPAKPSDGEQALGSDYHRNWAHVEKIASLSTPVTRATAADAIAMDVLAAATQSLPAICTRLAAEAAAPLGSQPDADQQASPDTAGSPDMAKRFRKSLMQAVLVLHSLKTLLRSSDKIALDKRAQVDTSANGYDFKAHDELREKLLQALALHSFPPELSPTYTASLAEMPEVLAQHNKLRSALALLVKLASA
ncbi:hypothetical protein WJX84_000152 [Apatococcus fuscideae]|uniref:UvrD-like helicase C-terminal domain-containing protein n=1 Tax=Apatococcus fuscideae TaxID=2026836 RepID=A0AAW1SS87_9CHLO